MSVAVILLGLVIAGLGVVGSVRPDLIGRAVLGWQPRTRSRVAIGARVVFGVVLLLGAPNSRFPIVLYALGGIAIVAAIVLAFVGSARTDELVKGWFNMSPAFLRIWLLAAVVFGAFLVYSGAAT
ncbi:MAG: hypothetical protein CL910_02705 [Deltaproteobacteria bacterium]|jgi:hypothetical protein|nr:hypothetical protein [Deltaproteobacteria bacterium]